MVLAGGSQEALLAVWVGNALIAIFLASTIPVDHKHKNKAPLLYLFVLLAIGFQVYAMCGYFAGAQRHPHMTCWSRNEIMLFVILLVALVAYVYVAVVALIG